jgi:hypothetical protein
VHGFNMFGRVQVSIRLVKGRINCKYCATLAIKTVADNPLHSCNGEGHEYIEYLDDSGSFKISKTVTKFITNGNQISLYEPIHVVFTEYTTHACLPKFHRSEHLDSISAIHNVMQIKILPAAS